MEETDSWILTFKTQLDEILEYKLYSNNAGRLGLDTALITAQKLEKHSKKCSRCAELKPVFLEYLQDLQNLEPEAFFVREHSYKLSTLQNKKYNPIQKHLKKVHHYKGTMDNRISYVFIGLFLVAGLPIINLFVDFGWNWLFSFPLLTVTWLVGYTLDKRNKKKGWVI